MRRGENIDCSVPCEHQTTHLTDCLEYTRCLYDYNIRKVHNICLCEKADCDYEYACPHIEKLDFKNNNIEGYTTYEVSLELKDLNSNIYAIYGDDDNNMIIPEAYQLPGHQGANIGGIKLGITIALAKCLVVSGTTTCRISLSLKCTCQSSGLIISISSIVLSYL